MIGTSERARIQARIQAVEAERVTRVRLDDGDLDQAGPLQGVIPLVDDRRDHHVEVELG